MLEITSERRSRGAVYTQIYRNCSSRDPNLTDHCRAIAQPWARIDGPAAMPNDENSEKQVIVVVISALAILVLVFFILLHVIQVIH